MYNVKALRRKYDSVNELPKRKYSGGGDKFPWLTPTFLEENTTFEFRLLPPDPAKNPSGVHFYINYNLPLDQEGKSKAKFPSLTMFGEKDCPVTNFLESVLDEEGELLPELRRIPMDAQKRLKEFAPQVFRLIPTIWKANTEKVGDYMNFFCDPTGASQVGAILNLKAQASLDVLFEDLMDLMEREEEIGTLDEGSWIKIRRKKYDYRLTLGEREDITGHPELQFYPNLAAYGNKNRKDRESIISLIESTYVYRELSKVADIELG